eukprot:TRINITY_DN7668_c0_g1_i2.p1 TRINITY_DN7668_c0_g1~~TRINITY_DN7668_c0_g1_i2.p1  ORF type:complete len:200 (-),score=41.32 TRINITY_DN7668_c0_g1_i2:110-709(-)
MTCIQTAKDVLYEAKWISLKQISYTDPKGVDRKWESVERTTRRGDIDGVDIIAIVRHKDPSMDKIVTVVQYRPPSASRVMEFPAGLSDEGEDPVKSATRELHEETGYIVEKVVHISPPVLLEPGLSNASTALVHLEIDADRVENQKPVAQLDEGEFIEVVLLPLADLLSALTQYRYDHPDVIIDSRLYSFAYGLSYHKR